MGLELFGEQLRKHREEKKISLGTISESTRINTKFLEAIESGKFFILPQAYIRAFVREYARALELNPEEVIHQYDAANREIHDAAEQRIAASQNLPMIHSEERSEATATLQSVSRPTIAFVAIAFMALLFVVYFTTSGDKTYPQPPVVEIPFDKVVKESEAALAKPEPASPSAIASPSSAQTVEESKSDSLRLEVTTLDSVWMSIVIDNVRRGDFLFPPKRKRVWVGKEQFSITIGNAGSATFRLNGIELGPLGKRGAVVRNVIISESGVQKPE